MKYQDFRQAVKGMMGYLIIPKFLFKDKGMLYLMNDFDRNSIEIFHTYRAFKSNKEWLKSWNKVEFCGQFKWGLVYTESDFVIGSGCWKEIDSFLKAKLPIYHVHFKDRYRFSNVVGVTAPIDDGEDWQRYSQVITDDQKDIRLETLIPSHQNRQVQGKQETRLQGSLNSRVKKEIPAGKKLHRKRGRSWIDCEGDEETGQS